MQPLGIASRRFFLLELLGWLNVNVLPAIDMKAPLSLITHALLYLVLRRITGNISRLQYMARVTPMEAQGDRQWFAEPLSDHLLQLLGCYLNGTSGTQSFRVSKG